MINDTNNYEFRFIIMFIYFCNSAKLEAFFYFRKFQRENSEFLIIVREISWTQTD